MQSKLTFYGGAGSVTGSNFMLDAGDAKFLIDCGFEQGSREKEEKNREPFKYDVTEPTHLFVSHAHIDHIGRIPLIVKHGFKGTIVSTHATKALSRALLRDAQAIDAEVAKREGREPLYEPRHVDEAMKRWEARGYHEPLELPGGMTHEFMDAGHILGSSMSRFSRGSASLVVTGDLGGGNSPLLNATEPLRKVEYLVVESVYGDKVRQDENRRELLENAIEDAAARGGSLLIPAFSTERTQDLLFEIRTLMMEKRIPSMPVYLDSPLASEITAAYETHSDYFSPEIKARVEAGEKIFRFPELTFVESPEESHKIQNQGGSKIILAGSGMGSGGRVRSHYAHILPDERNTLLVVGYQAAGTLGRKLIEGAKAIDVNRQVVPVRARIAELYGYSAHKDGEQLLEFVDQAAGTLKQVFVVEGEPAAAGFLTQRIRDYLSIRATAPGEGDSATIEL